MAFNNSSNLLIHHHAVAYQDGEKIWVQSFIACWIKALSQHFGQVGLLLNISKQKFPKQDTIIQEPNVILHPLGEVFQGKKVSELKDVKNVCKEVGSKYDILVIRGITPQQMIVFQNCSTPKKAFLLVGSIRDSKPKLSFHWISLFVRLKYHQRIHQIKQMAKSALILANSPHVVTELKDQLDIKAEFLPTNTISADDFIPFQKKEIKSKPEILFCGRVVQDKGIEELIKAIGILKTNTRNVRLKIVGSVDSGYQQNLISLAKDQGVGEQVDFEGFVSFGEPLLDYYRNADVYVLPSWHEGFPHSIWEAAASCTPIITTKVGGIPGLMTADEVFFIKAKNPESIAKKIEYVLNHEKEVNEKVAAVYEKAKTFTVEKCAERIFTKLALPKLVLDE